MNRSECTFDVRGTNYNIQIGFMIRVARENLHEVYRNNVMVGLEEELQSLISEKGCSINDLLWITRDKAEYKVVKQRVNKTCLRVNYTPQTGPGGNTSDEEVKKTSKRLSDYDSEDPENYATLPMYSAVSDSFSQIETKQGMMKAGRAAAQMNNQPKEESYNTSTFLMFFKPSIFKKENIGEIMNIIQHQCGFEIVGMRMVDMRKNLFYSEVPSAVQHLFKSVSYKFNRHHLLDEIKMRRKMFSFKTFVLVLRGMDVENRIDEVYNRETLKFTKLDVCAIDTSAQALFLTNQVLLEPFFKFVLNTKLLYLYHDIASSGRHGHLMDSVIFSRLISANSGLHTGVANTKSAVYNCSNYIEIKKWEHLHVEEEGPDNLGLSACVVVIKPSQSQFQIAIRTLRSIITKHGDDDKDEKLDISKLQIVQYTDEQIEMLYKYDLEYDETLSTQMRNKKAAYIDFFKQGEKTVPCIQALITGRHAISKVQKIVGDKDPRNAVKNTMRSFYASDRFDNAFFISENFAESLIERDILFHDETSNGHPGLKVVSRDTAKSAEAMSPID